MADPITASFAVSMGLTAIGAGVSAYGASKSAGAQAGMFTYQAGVAQVRKQMAEQDKDYALKAGEVEAQQLGMRTKSQVGNAKAIQSASGLDVNAGSPAAVRSSISAIGGEDVAISRANTARKAYGFDVKAMDEGIQSTVDTVSSKNSISAGKIAVISSLLGGASSVSSKWMQGSQAGIGSGGGGGGSVNFGNVGGTGGGLGGYY